VQRAGLGHPVFGARKLGFHAVVEPLFQLRLRRLGHAMKAQPGKALHIGPGNFGFDLDVDAAFRQRELHLRSRAFRQSLAQQQGDAALADVGAVRSQSLALENHFDLHLHWLPEVAPTLFQHEIQRGVKAARSI